MLADQSIQFINSEDAERIPMISKIYNLPFVESIFLSKNFISIAKTDNIEWGEITLELRNFITTILNEDEIQNYTEHIEVENKAQIEDNIKDTKASNNINKGSEPKTDLERNIVGLLNEYIRPAVEADGGAIEFDSFDEGTVKVVLKGACSGCPSSTATLKQGIESLLIQKLGEEIKEVVAING
jgi:Fe-S cluster biogenesis protein NfuA